MKSAFESGEIVGRMNWMGPDNHDLSDDQLASRVLRHLMLLEALGAPFPEPLQEFIDGHLSGYREAQRVYYGRNA
jgi:hypothetical protein